MTKDSQRRFSFPAPLPVGLILVTILSIGFVGPADALSFRADFVSSTYQTRSGDTFSDLLVQHQAGTPIQANATSGLENISTAVYAAGVTRNYGILMSTTIDFGVAGTYAFQVGTDWGRGGATALIDNSTGAIVSERVITGDVWWAYDWNDPDVFTTAFSFAPGDSYSLVWVGFEGCCGGSSTIRFSFDGGAFQALNATNLRPYLAASVPEPGTALLFGLGLMGLALATTRRSDFPRS